MIVLGALVFPVVPELGCASDEVGFSETPAKTACTSAKVDCAKLGQSNPNPDTSMGTIVIWVSLVLRALM
jgi:hypothetical protein